MMQRSSILQKIEHPIFEKAEVKVYVKRDDLIHSEIMGNKWRKLKYNLQKVLNGRYEGVLTLGGAYSNHIAATAAACKERNIECIGIIRGEELNAKSNPTLVTAHSKGMKFEFVRRDTYKGYRENIELLNEKYSGYYLLPEGGTNQLAIKGCAELVHEIPIDFDIITTPVGTGGTLAGILSGLGKNQKVLGISSLKGDFIHNTVEELLELHQVKNKNYDLITNYNFGGYGKVSLKLIYFINWFEKTFQIQLDPIYTGKVFFGVLDMIRKNKFEKNLRIVLLHTGGLQGIGGIHLKKQNIIQ